MCLVDITYFETCSCILVGFSRSQEPMVSSMKLSTPIDTPCGLPVVVSRYRHACDYSGLFCPQRNFYSNFLLERHNGRCQGDHKQGPKMTVSGLHMSFHWFKGFLTLDMGLKMAGASGSPPPLMDYTERDFISSYRPLYSFPEDVDNYSNPDLYRDYMRPLQLLHPYDGDSNWIYPMYILFGSMSYEILEVLPRSVVYAETVGEQKYIDAMNHFDYYLRAPLNTVDQYVMIHYKRQLRLRDAAGYVALTNVWDPQSDFCNNCVLREPEVSPLGSLRRTRSYPCIINLAPISSHYEKTATVDQLAPPLDQIPDACSTRYIERAPDDLNTLSDDETDMPSPKSVSSDPRKYLDADGSQWVDPMVEEDDYRSLEIAETQQPDPLAYLDSDGSQWVEVYPMFEDEDLGSLEIQETQQSDPRVGGKHVEVGGQLAEAEEVVESRRYWVGGGPAPGFLSGRASDAPTAPHWSTASFEAQEKAIRRKMLVPDSLLEVDPGPPQARTSSLELNLPVKHHRDCFEERPVKRVRWTEPYPVDPPTEHDSVPTEYVDVEVTIKTRSGHDRIEGEIYEIDPC